MNVPIVQEKLRSKHTNVFKFEAAFVVVLCMDTETF